jgi:hypothetical protein
LQHLAVFEGMVWDDLAEYQACRQAYARLGEAERARLHILPPEVAAARYEARLKGQTLCAAVVALLGAADRVADFVVAEALGIIKANQPYQGRLNNYALNLPEGLWWLAEPAARPSRLIAITRFCLAQRPLRYDAPERGVFAELPYPAVQARITAVLGELAQQREQQGAAAWPKEQFWGWVRGFQGSRRARWALEVAERLQALQTYFRAAEAALQSEALHPEERDLLLLLSQVAREMFDANSKQLLQRLG